MEMVSVADSAESAEGDSKILVITRGENASTALGEAPNGGTVVGSESVADVDSEEPELIEVGLVESGENAVVSIGEILAIAGGDFEEASAISISEAAEMLGDEGEASDVPVISGVRNRGL
jgi:hypothetical protein